MRMMHAVGNSVRCMILHLSNCCLMHHAMSMQVQLWDFGHQQGRVGHGSLQHARGSLHAPLLADSHLPVNAIAKCPATQGCTLIAAHDDGHLSWA